MFDCWRNQNAKSRSTEKLLLKEWKGFLIGGVVGACGCWSRWDYDVT